MTGDDATPMALALKAYFDARALCLRADPPCITRPCERHHAEACAANGATTCPACDGLDLVSLGMEPCEVCDGYGYCWIAPRSALASTLPGPVSAGRAGSVDGAAELRAPSQPAPAPAASTSVENNRPGTRNPEAAYRPNDLGQKQV